MVRPFDANLTLFFSDTINYIEDETHFDSGVYYACYYTYEWVPVIECGYYFDPTGFSIPAINFLSALIAPTNSGQLVPGSADAVEISDVLESMLSVPIMRNSLEQPNDPNDDPSIPEQCRADPTPDNAHQLEFCNSFYIARAFIKCHLAGGCSIQHPVGQ